MCCESKICRFGLNLFIFFYRFLSAFEYIVIVERIDCLMKQLIICIVIFTSSSFAGDSYGNVFVDTVLSVYDGDTFRCNILGWQKIVGKNIPIRVAGVDTPEMRGVSTEEKELAKMARDYTLKLLKSGKVIELRNCRRGKYFRIVADVYIDGKNLALELIKYGFGVRYE